jgi:hypothetical protein
MDVVGVAKTICHTKSVTNKLLYRLKAAGRVRVVSGFGFREEKGAPVWCAC